MIKDIKELNFPAYATLETATATISDMGDRTITTQIKIDGNVVPDFSYDWEVEFKGERYIHPVRTPQGTKDNSSHRAKIDLVFQHWAIYEMKRNYFVEMASTTAGTAIADKYIAPLGLNLADFVTAFNLVLNHYFDGRIVIRLNPEWQYDTEAKFVSISYSYIWDVLQQIHEIYGVRWTLKTNAEGVCEILMGYPAEEVSHIFEYGFEGGLLSVQRQVQSTEIRNRLLGRGGEKNLPLRYFKDKDPNNPLFDADPDWIPELANIAFTELRGKTFRDYVKGWKAKRYGGNIMIEPTEAYLAGYNAEKFDPTEYVEDKESIAKYGVLIGALENNDEIYPSIQGAPGDVDMIVDADQVSDDDIDSAIENDSVVSNLKSHRETRNNIAANSTFTFTIGKHVDAFFSIPEGKVGNLDMSITATGLYLGIPSVQKTHPILKADTIRVGIYDKNTDKEIMSSGVPVNAIPSGDYYYMISVEIDSNYDKETNVTLNVESIHLYTSTPGIEGWKNTFSIWVRNIWGSTRNAGETDQQYADRVWRPILGDRTGGEARVVFTSGWLSFSSDWEFPIVGYAYDDSKDGSHWRLTLAKSEAELQASGKYIPYEGYNAAAGDRFFFIGIDMPHQYVLWAEERLDNFKKDSLLQTADINPTWVIKTDKIRLHQDSKGPILVDSLNAGAQIRLASKQFISGAYETLYVQALTYNWTADTILYPDVEVVVSDKVYAVKNPVAQIQSNIETIQKQVGSLSNIQQIIREVCDKLYLRKDGFSDISKSPTKFLGKVTGETFRQGQIGGKDWGIYRDENGNAIIEADQIVARQGILVSNLVVNEATYVGGLQINSVANMNITTVEETDGGYVCYFDQKQGTVTNKFKIDDIVLCQKFDADQSELKFYKRRVISVSETFVTLSKNDVNGTGIPSEDDVIIHYGNYTDKTRQFVIVRDVIGGGYERMLMGLDSVTSDGVEYYFAGKSADSKARWFVGGAEQYAEYKDGQLTIKGNLYVAGGNKPVNEQIADLDFIKDAFGDGTQGLILGTAIIVGYNNDQGNFVPMAGLSGVYDNNVENGGPAAWYGGTPENAKSIIFMDGTGYFASGNIRWDKEGGAEFGGGDFKIKPDGSIEFGENIKISTKGDETLGTILTQLATFNDWFQWADADHTTLRTKYNFFTEGQLATGEAGAAHEGEGGGGRVNGIIINGTEYVEVDNYGNLIVSETLATLSDLASYLKDTDADKKFATKTYVNDTFATITSLGGVDARLKEIEEYFNGSGEDADNKINKWNEIVAFLNATEGTTLAGILAAYTLKTDHNALAERVTANEGAISGINTTLASHSSTLSEHTTAINTLGSKVNPIDTWFNEVGKFFKKDSDGVWYVDGNFYTKGQNAAGAVGSPDGGGSSGSGVMLLESWANVPSDLSGYALSAALGIDLHERFNNYYTIGDVDSRFSGINSRLATLDSGMADRYTKSESDGRYLKLSGGTITGDITTPFAVNTLHSREVGMYLKMSGSNVGWLGYTPNVGMYLYTYGNPNHKLGISDEGVGFIDSNTILHSGNANKADVPWTASNILFPTGTSATWNIHSTNAYKGITVLNAVQAKPEGAPDHYAVGLSVSGYYGFTLASLGGGDVLLYRRTNKADWKTIAFTDSTVDKARALVYYDTNVVSVANSNLDVNRNATSGELFNSANLGFEISCFPTHIALKGYSATNMVSSLILNSSGNATIGAQDLALTTTKLYVDGGIRFAPRTLWGQSFDGTKDIEGDIKNVTLIRFKDSGIYGIYRGVNYSDNLTANDLAYVSVKHAFYTSGYQRLFINQYGNVTIGNTDFAGTDTKLYVNGTGRFTDLLTASAGISTPHITIGGITISVVDGVLRIDGNVYTTGQLGVGAVGQEGGGTGGGGVLLLNTWPTDGGSYAGYALGGNLGIDLNTRVKTLEGKATAVSFSQTLTSGKQIGVLTIDGSSSVLYAPSTYAWSEITSRPSKLSDFTDDVVSGKYLSLSGGTITGQLILQSGRDVKLILDNTDGEQYNQISIRENGVEYAAMYWTREDTHLNGIGNFYYNSNILLHSGNYSNYALPLTGGTIEGASGNYTPLIVKNTSLSEVWIAFIDSVGTTHIGSVRGVPSINSGSGNQTLLHSGNYSNYALPLTGGTISGNLTVDGYIIKSGHFFGVNNNDNAEWYVTDKNWQNTYTLIHSGNIGSQKVASADYATSAGDADTLDGYSSGRFLLMTGRDYTEMDLNTIGDSQSIFTEIRTSEVTTTNSPHSGYGALLSLKDRSGIAKMQFLGSYNSSVLYFRSQHKPGADITSNWKTIAFTDSTVDKARALVYYDTNVVSVANSNLDINRNVTSGELFNSANLGFEISCFPTHIALKGYSATNRVSSLILNSSGNVTIGASDLALTTTKLYVDGGIRFSPRTIWGQSFDGTGNVSGNLLDINNQEFIYSSGTWTRVGNGTAKAGLPTYIDGNDIYLRYGKSQTTGFILNASGNVTIGGNVLVGTTTDNGYKLDVDGIAHVRGLYVGNSVQANLIMSRPSYNYIWAEQAGGTLVLGVQDVGATGPQNASLWVQPNFVTAGTRDNAVALGSENYRWSAVHAFTGRFSGNVSVSGIVTASSGIKIGSILLTDENGTLKIAGNAYTTGQLGAGEAGRPTSGGGNVILDYDSIVDALGFTPASSSQLTTLTNRVASLERKQQWELDSNGVAFTMDAGMVAPLGTPHIIGLYDAGQCDLTVGDGSYVTKLYGSSILANDSEVLTKANTSFTRNYSSGTKIGTIKVGGVSTDIYAPTSGSSSLWSTEYDMTVGTEVLFGSKEYIGTNTIVGWDSAGLCVNDLYIGYDGYTIWMQGSVDEASDMRLKTVIDAVNLDIRDIAFAPIFNYVFKSRPQGRQMLGSSAQYWQAIAPKAVSENDKGNLAMNYGAIALASVVAVAKKVVTHEEEIAELKSKVQSLETRLAKYELN